MKKYLGLLLQLYSKYISHNAHSEQLGRWYFNNGDDQLVSNLNLSESSVVFEIGGFTGAFTQRLINKYSPSMYIFEPIKQYFDILVSKFGNRENIHIYNIGLSNTNKNVEITLAGEGSSAFTNAAPDSKQTVVMNDISEFINTNNISHIDLMCINIEGGEYDLLNRLIETGQIKLIDVLQIQFHTTVENYGVARDLILQKLSKYFEPGYSYPYVWERFVRK